MNPGVRVAPFGIPPSVGILSSCGIRAGRIVPKT